MPRLLLPLLASSSLLSLVACTGDPAPPTDGQFGGADQAHLGRALAAASGVDALTAQFIAGIYASADGVSTCPALVRDGDTVTATGGCDTDTGRIEGRVVMVNVPSLFGDDNDPEAPQRLTFEGFTVDEPGEEPMFVDGTLRFDPATRITSSDLVLDLGGIEARSRLELRTDDGLITAAAGSEIDVEGLGEAAVSGTWSLSRERPAGQLTLTGEQVLAVHFDDATLQCVPYSIDGAAAGELCDE